MSEAIDSYFDYASPCRYLASGRIGAIASKHGQHIVWHPNLLGARIGEQHIKDTLLLEVEQAIAKSLVGSAIIFLDAEPFGGNDRLTRLECWRSTGG